MNTKWRDCCINLKNAILEENARVSKNKKDFMNLYRLNNAVSFRLLQITHPDGTAKNVTYHLDVEDLEYFYTKFSKELKEERSRVDKSYENL